MLWLPDDEAVSRALTLDVGKNFTAHLAAGPTSADVVAFDGTLAAVVVVGG